MPDLTIKIHPRGVQLLRTQLTSLLAGLAESLPAAPHLPEDDPELAAAWRTHLHATLQADCTQLAHFFASPVFGTGSLPLSDTQAEALLRAAAAIRIKLRHQALAALSDAQLESGDIHLTDLSPEHHAALLTYGFLAQLQQALVHALDPLATD